MTGVLMKRGTRDAQRDLVKIPENNSHQQAKERSLIFNLKVCE
jgi:hypothetical protein